MNAKPKTLNL